MKAAKEAVFCNQLLFYLNTKRSKDYERFRVPIGYQ